MTAPQIQDPSNIRSTAPAASSEPRDPGTRGYISGAGAISIAFLIELLKLNQEVRNEMALLNQQTIAAQTAVYTAAAQAQVDLYDSQSQELMLQMGSQIASATMSGISIGAGFVTKRGSEEPAAKAKLAEEQMESFNKIQTHTDLNTTNAGHGEESPHEQASPEKERHMKLLREQLVNGGFGPERFSEGDLGKAVMKLNLENGTSAEYKVADVIKSAEPGSEDRKKIAENFAKSRDDARETLNASYQKWSQVSQFINTGTQMISGSVDSGSKAAQAKQKEAQGAEQAIIQETQGESTVWSSAQKATTDQREGAQGNVGQVLQTIRELVAADVRG